MMDMNRLDDKLNEVTASIVALEHRFSGLENKFSGFETKFEQAQVKMQDTIISTMIWYIGGAGVVLIVLKPLDIFIK